MAVYCVCYLVYANITSIYRHNLFDFSAGFIILLTDGSKRSRLSITGVHTFRRLIMVQWNDKDGLLQGLRGSLAVRPDDEVVRKLLMLIEGECEGLGRLQAAKKYGYSKQRYFQIRAAFLERGSAALVSGKRGPKTKHRRTGELVRQIIRHRFLDPDASPAVICQKLRQTGLPIGVRSVERTIAEFGLQKKTLQLPPPPRRRQR
jgi:transposase